MRISAALLPWNWKLAQTRPLRLRVPPAAALGRRLRPTRAVVRSIRSTTRIYSSRFGEKASPRKYVTMG